VGLIKKLLGCSSQVWLLPSGEEIKRQMNAGAGTNIQWGYDASLNIGYDPLKGQSDEMDQALFYMMHSRVQQF